MLCLWERLFLVQTIPIALESTDYVLADVEASSCIKSCEVLEDTNQNTSDHLALSMTISCDVSTQFTKDTDWKRIDWAKATKSGATLKFQGEVYSRLKPFIGRSRGNSEHIDAEIRHVAWLISDAAVNTLPQLKPRKTNKNRDRTLSQLCMRSKEAWKAWNNEGRPETGPLYEAKSIEETSSSPYQVLCRNGGEKASVAIRGIISNQLTSSL